MKVLAADDEEPILELIKYNIEREGWTCITSRNGREALDAVRDTSPDIVLLDLMLPDISGLDVLRVMKSDRDVRAIPVIIVSARGEDADIVKGLELGADDYVTKPFSPKVLVARIQSVMRRRAPGVAEADDGVIHVRDVVINPARHTVTRGGNNVELSASEFSILEFLARGRGRVYTRKEIISSVRGSDYPVTERSIDVQILGIRKRLGESLDSARPLIETVRGVGYRFCDE